MTTGVEITSNGLLSCQCCALASMKDAEIERIVNEINPTSISSGWRMRVNGDPALAGAPYRVPCAYNPSRVHIMFDC